MVTQRARRSENAVKIGLVGEGPLASAYSLALADCRDAGLVASCGRASEGALGGAHPCGDADALFQEPSLDAVVVAGGANGFSLARGALLAGKHVLVAGGGLPGPRHVRALQLLAESRSRLLLFGEERLLSPPVGFLRRMLADGDGLWRPLYLRGLSVSQAGQHGAAGIAHLAVEDLAVCLHILDRPVTSVNAVAHCAAGPPLAATIDVTFAEGIAVGLQVSVAEAWDVRQLVVALADRTVILDERDARAPLKIISSSSGPSGRGSHRLQGVARGADTDRGALAGRSPSVEPVRQQCQRFVEAVARGDVCGGNAAFWARVAAFWEAAERSMAEGGVPVTVESEVDGEYEARRSVPRLRLIRSGGARRDSTLPKPSLTLVGG
jgi:predicted dehydrogenase